MSRSSNFTVPEESKLVGVAYYKQWANRVIIQLMNFYWHLNMVLEGWFHKILDITGLVPRHQAKIFVTGQSCSSLCV